jgi:homoaconitase/3-isopropylmalate dehydratase large subunit
MSNKYYKLSDAVLESILTGSAIYIAPDNETILFINGRKVTMTTCYTDRPPERTTYYADGSYKNEIAPDADEIIKSLPNYKPIK